MGWDAYAVRPEVDPRTSSDEFLTPALQEFFRRANQELVSIVGSDSDNLGTGRSFRLTAAISRADVAWWMLEHAAQPIRKRTPMITGG